MFCFRFVQPLGQTVDIVLQHLVCQLISGFQSSIQRFDFVVEPLRFFRQSAFQILLGCIKIGLYLFNGCQQRIVCFVHFLLQSSKLFGQGVDIRLQEGIRADICVRQVGNSLIQCLIGVPAKFFDGFGQVRIDLVNRFLQCFIRFCHSGAQSFPGGLLLRIDLRLQQRVSRFISCDKLGQLSFKIVFLFIKRSGKFGDLILQLLY